MFALLLTTLTYAGSPAPRDPPTITWGDLDVLASTAGAVLLTPEDPEATVSVRGAAGPLTVLCSLPEVVVDAPEDLPYRWAWTDVTLRWEPLGRLTRGRVGVCTVFAADGSGATFVIRTRIPGWV